MSAPTIRRPRPFSMDNTFARQTMAIRVPGIIRDLQTVNPDYPSVIMAALDRLHAGLTGDGPIPMLDGEPVPTADYAGWLAAYQEQAQQGAPLTWLSGKWFFNETLLYRHVIQAVRWYETGRDPYRSYKQAELASDRFGQLVDAALTSASNDAERLWEVLGFALWGNRVDLSHPAGTLAADAAAADDLLVDDRETVLRYLADTAQKGDAIHVIADNAGSELAMDFVLIDTLLAASASPVVLHVKAHPVFVSDTIIADVWQTLGLLAEQGAGRAALAGRLRAAFDAGRLKLATHPFWTSSRFLHEMPEELRAVLAGARLVILKGDVNYRRAVGDTMWDAGVSFDTAVADFPAPLLALRSLKCDALVGVDAARVEALDALGEPWRITGQYGVIQFANKER